MNKLLSGIILFFYATMASALTNIWQGSYVGVTAGGDWGSVHARTSTVAGGYLTAADASAVNREGDQPMHPNGFTAGIDAGYNWLYKQTLLGLEADLNSVRFGDSVYSNSISYPSTPAFNFVVGSYVNINWLATLRPRLGYTIDNKLFYITGGLGLTNLHANFYFNDSAGALSSGSIDQYKWGYTLGCGVEMNLSKAWRVKLEYLYADFSSTNADKTSNSLLATFPNQQFAYSTNLNANFLRLVLNYY